MDYNHELKDLYIADQKERQEIGKRMAGNPGGNPLEGIDPAFLVQMQQRDRIRRAKVYAFSSSDQINTPLDFLCAAGILQHGETPDDYKRAHSFAAKGLEQEPSALELEVFSHAMDEIGCAAIPGTDNRQVWDSTMKFWAACTLDRYLMMTGKPQKYGTQMIPVGNKTMLYEVDPTVSDAERAAYNIPPLAELRKRYPDEITGKQLQEMQQMQLETQVTMLQEMIGEMGPRERKAFRREMTANSTSTDPQSQLIGKLALKAFERLEKMK